MKQKKTIIALSLGLILGIGLPLHAQSTTQSNAFDLVKGKGSKTKDQKPKNGPDQKNNPPGQNNRQDPTIRPNPAMDMLIEDSEQNQNTNNEPSGGDTTQNGNFSTQDNSNNSASTSSSKKMNLGDAVNFVEDFINNEGIDTQWDNSDGSLNFRDSRSNLFWITFKENNNDNFLYTLYKQSIRPESKEDDVEENLIYTANYITQNAPYKAIYKHDDKGGKIELTYPIYSSSPEEFCNVLFTLTETMKNSKELFDKGLKEGKEVNDALHYEWQYQTDNKKLIPCDKDQFKPTIKINNIQVKGERYEKGQLEDRVNYGNNMQRSLFDYITPKIEYDLIGDLKNGPKGCQLEIQLIDPSGKVCVYDEKLNYTEKAYIPFSKNKGGESDLPKIGSKGYSWDTGLYEIKIFENGKEIKGYKFYVDE